MITTNDNVPRCLRFFLLVPLMVSSRRHQKSINPSRMVVFFWGWNDDWRTLHIKGGLFHTVPVTQSPRCQFQWIVANWCCEGMKSHGQRQKGEKTKRQKDNLVLWKQDKVANCCVSNWWCEGMESGLHGLIDSSNGVALQNAPRLGRLPFTNHT